MMNAIALVVSLVVSESSPASPTPAPPTPLVSWEAQADALWLRRSDAAAVKELSTLLKDRLQAEPTLLEALVRKAMQQCWLADGMGDGTPVKASLGKSCWETAERAIAVAPNDARAQYWATVGIGLYSEGVGILTALAEGLEGKFLGRCEAAIKLDKEYLMGSPNTLLGRFYFKLPWPKRDLKKSAELLESTLKSHPDNLLAKYFLADTLEALDRKDEARKQIDEVLAAKATDPQDLRSQQFARRWLGAHK